METVYWRREEPKPLKALLLRLPRDERQRAYDAVSGEPELRPGGQRSEHGRKEGSIIWPIAAKKSGCVEWLRQEEREHE